MHWFDCLELGVKKAHGLTNRFINTGVGGDSTRDLLRRFECDAEFYRPHMAFVTIGGNDSFAQNGISAEEYEANLYELQRRFERMGCDVVFQTYYSPDPDQVAEPLDHFYHLMRIVRDVAKKTDSHLIDHLSRWEVFRENFNEEYKGMMSDGFHVNYTGNMLIGLDIARHFEVDTALWEDLPEYWSIVRDYQRRIDDLMK
jgi:lysophospholipase L1-like esterase